MPCFHWLFRCLGALLKAGPQIACNIKQFVRWRCGGPSELTGSRPNPNYLQVVSVHNFTAYLSVIRVRSYYRLLEHTVSQQIQPVADVGRAAHLQPPGTPALSRWERE